MSETTSCSSTVCAVCLHDTQDARLLTCLHSFCRSCIDRLAVTASERKLPCPLCRTVCELPKTGAVGLARNTLQPPQPKTCVFCDDAATSSAASRVCSTCEVAVCDNHVLDHLDSPGRHLMGKLADNSTGRSDRSTSVAECPVHGEPLKFFCKWCDETVCGSCIAIGGHSRHSSGRRFTLAKDEAKENMKWAVTNIQPLQEVLERAKLCWLRVNDDSRRLADTAGDLRQKIRSSAVRAVETVEACKEQLLQQVDDMEEERSKVLGMHSDELKSYRESVSCAIRYGKHLSEARRMETGNGLDPTVVTAFESRARNLLEEETVLCRKQDCNYLPATLHLPTEEDLPSKGMAIIGELRGGSTAKAANCVVTDTSWARKPLEDDTVFTDKNCRCELLISAKDAQGQVMKTGGDLMSARLSLPQCVRKVSSLSLPAVSMEDNNDGTYSVSFTLTKYGTYSLQISANGEPLTESVTIRCFQNEDYGSSDVDSSSP